MPSTLQRGYANISQLLWLEIGELSISKAEDFATEFQHHSNASNDHTSAFTQTLITTIFDLQYTLVMLNNDGLLSTIRKWCRNREWYDKLRTAEAQGQRIGIWVAALERDKLANCDLILSWLYLFRGSVSLPWLFRQRTASLAETRLRNQLQEWFKLKFILMLDVVFFKLFKRVEGGKATNVDMDFEECRKFAKARYPGVSQTCRRSILIVLC